MPIPQTDLSLPCRSSVRQTLDRGAADLMRLLEGRLF